MKTADPSARWLHDFEVDEPTCRRVLDAALERGADRADLYFQRVAQTSLSLEDGIVSRASTAVDRGVGIRSVLGDQTGFAYCEDLTEAPMRAAARAAATIASGPASAAARGVGVPIGGRGLYPVDRGWPDVELGAKLAIVRSVEERLRSADARIAKVSVSWVDSDEYVALVADDGRAASDRRPMAVLRASVTLVDGANVESNFWSLATRNGLEWFEESRLDAFAKDLIARTSILFEARRPPAGEMPVVLAAGASGILLHEAIGHGLEADANRKGVSIYANKVGERVAMEEVTVVDSGLHAGERGALEVDDEGNASERTVLIQSGVLEGYLHDTISAKHYDVAPTGSGRRESFRHVPLPRMRCTYMESGTAEPADVIASVKNGILAENFANGQVQIGAGDFTFFVKNGWLIEDGKVTAPIKDVNIIGNGPEALSRITMVANDSKLDTGGWTCGKAGQSVPVSQGMPTSLVSSLTVGGTNAQ
ncbi:protease TldD [Planctomycetes bacterium Pla163]|uniref:Protease TldD n=1 Tax=Rohdeia mirabilis TaxID=2528008 RepID=A0A518D490_9BACT|nr:protease TldD [Planctomycetes bacterium Pla163]